MTTPDLDRPAPAPYDEDARQSLANLVNIFGSHEQFDDLLAIAKALYGNGNEETAPITVTRLHVSGALTYYQSGWITAGQLQAWAQTIQLHRAALVTRPYLEYETATVEVIEEVLFHLAREPVLPYAPALIEEIDRQLRPGIRWPQPVPHPNQPAEARPPRRRWLGFWRRR